MGESSSTTMPRRGAMRLEPTRATPSTWFLQGGPERATTTYRRESGFSGVQPPTRQDSSPCRQDREATRYARLNDD